MGNVLRGLAMTGAILVGGSACGIGEQAPMHARDTIAPEDITSKDCGMLVGDLGLIYDPSTTTQPKTEAEKLADAEDYAQKLAINNDLAGAKLQYESIKRQIGTDTEKGILVHPDEFLADPEGAQAGLKATCAAFAGEISTSNTLLNSISNPQTKAAYGSDARYWQAFTAENLAKDEKDFGAAYDIVDHLAGATEEETVAARDEVEYWVSYGAKSKAEKSDFDEALVLVETIDDEGKTTKVTAHDEVDYWLQYRAENAAIKGDMGKASELISRIDEQGKITRAGAQAEIEPYSR